MKRTFLREHGKAGLELIEEAFVLLRTCPPAILAAYFLGSVPFTAGFLIFCADLSRHPEARDHLGRATLAMTALFMWMKFSHARFGSMLLARLRGDAPPSRNTRDALRSFCQQTIIQSTALFLLPVTLLLILPFGWVYAFYQNISALDDGKTRLRELVRSASRQSALWPVQNHFLQMVLFGFGFFIFLNWITLGFSIPQILKMFFGIESAFTLSPRSMFNTTFFAATAALTYLSIDPLIKTCYVLRCFYGRSLHSGDDLKMEVRRLSGRVPSLVVCLLFCFLSPALPADQNPPAPTPAVESGELNRSISTVIQQDKYTWRAPGKNVAEKKEGLLDGFFSSIWEMVEKTLKALADIGEKIMKWIFHRERFFHRENRPRLGHATS